MGVASFDTNIVSTSDFKKLSDIHIITGEFVRYIVSCCFMDKILCLETVSFSPANQMCC